MFSVPDIYTVLSIQSSEFGLGSVIFTKFYLLLFQKAFASLEVELRLFRLQLDGVGPMDECFSIVTIFHATTKQAMISLRRMAGIGVRW